MGLDQDLQYRVRIDDSDFQAKLSQMRASVDMMMGSSMGALSMPGTGMAGMGGMPMSYMAGNIGSMMMPGSAYSMGGLGGGFADFGLSVRPITYTSPAIAMQPHFGMVQVRQGFMQAVNNSMQPFTPFGSIPQNIGAGELSEYSARQVGDRVGDAVGIGAATLGSFALGGIGYSAGSAVGTFAATKMFSSAAMAAAGETSLMGSVLLGAGGLAGGIMGSMAGAAYLDAVTDRMAENRAVQNALAAGSFRFVSGGADLDPITGRGFSRGARQSIASSIQGMELQDVRYGMNEYQQVLESGMQLDMFSGTRDAQDFKERFSKLVETVKVIQSTLHTSISEGMEAMRGMRDMGVDTPQGMAQIAMRSELAGRMSGRTGMEMVSIGQTGAEMFRGTGINMQVGFESMQNNMVTIRGLLNQGLISRETIGQAGGEQALAQQMTSSALASTQTAFGRAFMMSMYDPAAGGMREGAMGGMGGISLMGAANRLSGMTPGQMLSFQADQRQMVNQLGAGGLEAMATAELGSMASLYSQQFGMSMDKAAIVAGENMGMPYEVIQARMAALKQDPAKTKDDMARQEQVMYREARSNAFYNTYGFKALGNAIMRTTVQPVSDFLSRTGAQMGAAVEETMTSLSSRLMTGVGYTNESLTTDAVAEGERLVSGGAKNAAFIDATGGGIMGLFKDRLGEKLSNAITATGTAADVSDKEKEFGVAGALQYNEARALRFKSRADAENYQRNTHSRLVLLDNKDKDGYVLAMEQGEIEKTSKFAYEREVTEADRKRADKMEGELSHKVDIDLVSLRSKKGGATADDVTQAIFGKDVKYNGIKGASLELVRRKAHEMGLDAAIKQGEAESRSMSLDTLSYIAEQERSGIRDAAQMGRALLSTSEFNADTSWFKRGAPGRFEDVDTETVRKAAEIYAGHHDAEGEVALRKALKGKDVDQINRVISAVDNMSESERTKFHEIGQNISLSSKNAADAASAINAGAAAGTDGQTGMVSKDQLATVAQAVEQMKNSMMIIMNVQQVLKQRGVW